MKKFNVYPKNTFVNLPEDKRSHIVSVMIREFALNGYRKASLNAIAKDAGVSKGSLYQYFRSKEEIFLYVFDQFTSLVKRSMAEQAEIAADGQESFWDSVKTVLLAGIRFIKVYPEYFKLYLRVLFEHDLPRREELLASVRLFSREYFLPKVIKARRGCVIREDVSADMVVFCLDAMLDRFLQGYAKPYFDGGLDLAKMSERELAIACDEVLSIVKSGLGVPGQGMIVRTRL